MKKARIIIKNCRGRHAGGDAENADMVLIAGDKGKGRVLATCHYWPWSPKSVEAAEDYMYAAAKRQGYKILPTMEYA